MSLKALSMWYCCYYIHTEAFIILPAFYFKSFKNPQMPKYASTHREMTKKTKYLMLILVLKNAW